MEPKGSARTATGNSAGGTMTRPVRRSMTDDDQTLVSCCVVAVPIRMRREARAVVRILLTSRTHLQYEKMGVR
jgi:hypothetical protein